MLILAIEYLRDDQIKYLTPVAVEIQALCAAGRYVYARRLAMQATSGSAQPFLVCGQPAVEYVETQRKSDERPPRPHALKRSNADFSRLLALASNAECQLQR